LRYFWDAALELDPHAGALHEGNRFPICQPEPLSQLWQSAGFNEVIVEALDIPTIFPSFDAYWQSFSLGNFPAPNYAMSLDQTHRDQLRERVQSSIPIAQDGTVNLIARVWAVRGSR
jgi:hypothetical protein